MSESGGNNNINNNNNIRQSAESELLEFCHSDSISEEGLREIIERLERHELTHLSNLNYDFFRAACLNGRVNEGIIQCLLEYFPVAANSISINCWSPLHCACLKNMTLGVIQLLINAAPDSVRSVNRNDSMPLHCLCSCNKVDEMTAIEILKLLLEKHLEAVQQADKTDSLPIHLACNRGKSPEFCRVLIEEYPGSERKMDEYGELPLHRACRSNTISTVEYLYKHYPDAINHAATEGAYPIHTAMMGLSSRSEPENAIDVVKFLLECDPNVKLQQFRGMISLIHFACSLDYANSNIHVGIEVVKAIYDAHPEAIDDNRFRAEFLEYHQGVQSFIGSQREYAREAKDHHLMTTPDGNGRLPLHLALNSRNNATLGSIKLLVKGNPPALQTPDNGGVIPLHVACANHKPASVVQYLVGLDTSTLDAVDRDGNTSLHYACCVARHEIIALLLNMFDAVSVSKRNTHGKLPIDLLWENSGEEDRECNECTESVFRLLKAYPELLMNVDMQMQSPSDEGPSQSGKKRKFDKEE